MGGLGLTFKLFVLAGLVAWFHQRRPGRARPGTALQLFLVVALGVSFAPGLTQRDAWPFAAWPLVAGTVPGTVNHPRLTAFDAAGGEHDIDARAWHPLGFDELMAWLQGPFERLPRVQQQRALAHLLARAEASRRAARAAGDPSSRGPGRLPAPRFLLHPRRWATPSRVPAAGFVGVRLYRELWNPEARARGAASARVLLAEYRAP